MGYELGIDLGTTYTAAAVHRDGRAQIVTLGNRSAAVPSVVLLRADETLLAGEAADRRAMADPDRVARQFKRRLGDPTPLLLGGVPYSAEGLMAKLLRWTVVQVAEREGGAPGAITVTHPANWGHYKKDLLEQAVRRADLDNVMTLTEPEAAAIYYASHERVEAGAVVAVYDLGGGTFDAAVLRKSDAGWEVLGAPEGIERLGGIDFDEAVFSHVTAALPEVFAGLDRDDPAVRAGIGRLRQDCVDVKEALSSDTDASIPVMLPSVQTEVRLTRGELESMVRPALQETMGAMRRALRTAALEAEDVDAVLLVGGSSRMPLVAQLVASEFGRPVAVDAHPKHAIALGAALAAAAAASPGNGRSPGGTASLTTGTNGASSREPAVPAVSSHRSPAASRGEGRPASGAAVATGDPPHLAESPHRMEAVTTDDVAGSTASGDTVPADATEPLTTEPAETRSTSSAGAGSWRRRPPVPAIVGIMAVVLLGGAAGAFAMRGGGDGSVDRSEIAGGAATDQERHDEMPEEPGTSVDDLQAEELASPPDSPEPPPEPPPEPEREPPYAEFTDIRIEDGRYILTYEPTGFTPIVDDAGAFHVHFFWDTLPVINAGATGPDPGRWLLWDTPFEVRDSFFDVAERPQGARQICVVIAENGHSVADVVGDGRPDTDTGDCIDIPNT